MASGLACAMKAGHRGSEIASELANLCVCGTYQRVKAAVEAATERSRQLGAPKKS